MYSQLIYFVSAILLESFYQPREAPVFSFQETVLLMALAFTLFFLFTRFRFRTLAKSIEHEDLALMDSRFSKITLQQTLLALVGFGLMIHGLGLPDFLRKPAFMAAVPTLASLVSLLVFLLLMTILWTCSHPLYCRIYRNPVSPGSYIRSNFSFALPVLLFFGAFNLCFDLLNLVPHEEFHGFITGAPGEVLFSLIFMVPALLAGPALIHKLWGCKPLEPGFHRNAIEAFCEKAGLKYRDILLWPLYGGKMITAGVMGFVHPFRYILISPALLRLLSVEELEAVVAHEAGHVKKNHMFLYLFFLPGFLVFMAMFIEIVNLLILVLSYRLAEGLALSVHASAISQILESFCFILGFALYFRYVFGFFMRNFERQADAYIYKVSADANSLISAFDKISVNSGIPSSKPNWHHFSIQERIGFLKACEKDRSLVVKHDRKLHKAMILFTFVLFFFSLLLLSPGFQNHKQQMLNQALLHNLHSQIQKDPENPDLYALLGNIYQQIRSYEEAAGAYDAALNLSPDNPDVLNNYAWMLATCPIPGIRNPEKAVELAAKAAGIMPSSPEILDTLAESLYGTGKIEKALEISAKALEEAKADPARTGQSVEYYEGQWKKFAGKNP
jgi:Zn-dependent protease with chaperone function